MNLRQINEKTILSLLILIAGVVFYLLWGVTYGVWADIGIYSITIILVCFGVFGTLLSLLEVKEEEK